jgi:hypothetical protein
MYLEAPNYLSIKDYKKLRTTVFLAGSITGAEDWQLRATSILLARYDIFNPRRADFNKEDSEQERIQIEWEWIHLNIASKILFWFSDETIAPITLFEYGKFLTHGDIHVGVHPEYIRRNDILIQTELEKPHLKIHSSLDSLCADLMNCAK